MSEVTMDYRIPVTEFAGALGMSDEECEERIAKDPEIALRWNKYVAGVFLKNRAWNDDYDHITNLLNEMNIESKGEGYMRWYLRDVTNMPTDDCEFANLVHRHGPHTEASEYKEA